MKYIFLLQNKAIIFYNKSIWNELLTNTEFFCVCTLPPSIYLLVTYYFENREVPVESLATHSKIIHRIQMHSRYSHGLHLQVYFGMH